MYQKTMQNTSKTRLPRQWKHWCKSAKLKPSHRGFERNSTSWRYLKGRGHFWRVNMHGILQMGDTYTVFDRWANSARIDRAVPSSKIDFEETIHDMLREWRHRFEYGKGSDEPRTVST